MAELIAEGERPDQRQRLTLEPGRTYTIGRDPTADLAVVWDRHVSRQHAVAAWDSETLAVRAVPEAQSGLFIERQQLRECKLSLGQHFVLGGTCFFLCATGSRSDPGSAELLDQMTFSREVLQHVRYHDPDTRIEVLSHLPDLIWGARSEHELQTRLVNLLLAGVPRAEVGALVALTRSEATSPHPTVVTLHWDRRRELAGAFRASQRLVTAALQQRESVLYMWDAGRSSAEFTQFQEIDWAFCTPVTGPASEGWGLYLGGRQEGIPWLADQPRSRERSLDLRPDIKFVELVAEVVGALRRLRHLERRQAGLRQFFPPVILDALQDDANSPLLAPREAEVTVMFCDLRGFSRQAEQSRDDLPYLLDRVSQALGVMTHHILKNGGVIGDFQGDAAMGFWGWPVALPEDPLHACHAALAIRQAFVESNREPGHPLAGFEMGIGLARGRAVAGKIGTQDHVKVTVFGPVVNLASRLEGMTKHLRAAVIIDESLAQLVRERWPTSEGRTRRLARVQPFGMETPVWVSELLPSERDWPVLTDQHLRDYEQAVQQFTVGRWDEAYSLLRNIPAADRAQDFLAMLIAQHNRVAPPDWNGIIKLPSK